MSRLRPGLSQSPFRRGKYSEARNRGTRILISASLSQSPFRRGKYSESGKSSPKGPDFQSQSPFRRGKYSELKELNPADRAQKYSLNPLLGGASIRSGKPTYAI